MRVALVGCVRLLIGHAVASSSLLPNVMPTHDDKPLGIVPHGLLLLVGKLVIAEHILHHLSEFLIGSTVNLFLDGCPLVCREPERCYLI